MKPLRLMWGRFIPCSMCCLLVTGLVLSAYAQAIVPKKYNAVYGMWAEARGRNFTTAEEGSALMQTIRENNFNALFAQVYADGTAFYRSRIVPRAGRIDTAYLDPLSDLIVDAHTASATENLVMVHPVFSTLRVYESWAEPVPPPGNIIHSHPDWITESFQGKKLTSDKTYYLDPGLPEVQNYIVALVMEVVQNYDVDGICLDEIRYPDSGREWGYNPQAVERFNRQFQRQGKPLPDDPQWCQWREEQLTQLVQRLFSALRSTKPGVDLTVAVDISGDAPKSKEEFTSSPAFYQGLQNWVDWADEGTVDNICLKNFWRGQPSGTEFVSWTDFALENKGKAKILVGISGFLNFTDAILPQMRLARMHGADGLVLFTYRSPTKDDPAVFFQTVKATIFSDSYAAMPPSGIPPYKPPDISLEQYTTPTLVELLSASLETSPTEVAPAPAVPGVTSPFEMAPEAAEIPLMPLTEIEPTTPTAVTAPTAVTTPTVAATPVVPEVAAVPTPKAEVVASPTPTATPVVTYELPPPPAWDTIFLTNGNSFKGRVVEEIDGETIIDTSSGMRLKIQSSLVDKIVKGTK